MCLAELPLPQVHLASTLWRGGEGRGGEGRGGEGKMKSGEEGGWKWEGNKERGSGRGK